MIDNPLDPKKVSDYFNELCPLLINAWDYLEVLSHDQVLKSGFYDNGGARNIPERIALMHAELSEALEAVRKNNPKSEKIPEYSAVEEEFADLVIRLAETAHFMGLDVAGAILAKLEYNRKRPYKHGKEF